MNFSILSEHLDDAKNFFQIDIMDVLKKVDAERFVDEHGKVPLKNSFFKTKSKERAGNYSPMQHRVQ